MRTLAIGDIHGCLSALETLWDSVKPTNEDKIIFMGDYVDRGPDTKGVINFLIDLQEKHSDITFLTGNHEEKLFLSTLHASDKEHWLSSWGAKATIDSYGESLDDIPDAHWNFLRTLHPYMETDRHIFVHANLEPDVPLNLQLPYTIIHKKFKNPEPHMSGKIMICGHTAQKTHKPLDIGHAVCIDTDPDRGGWLTCLHVETGDYIQSNQDREIREGKL